VEEIRGQGHVGGSGDGERFAVVQRLELGELLEVVENKIADLLHDAAPL
jgi:hypothetical protein